jgi:integral membrane sensor domain MASE1
MKQKMNTILGYLLPISGIVFFVSFLCCAGGGEADTWTEETMEAAAVFYHRGEPGWWAGIIALCSGIVFGLSFWAWTKANPQQ